MKLRTFITSLFFSMAMYSSAQTLKNPFDTVQNKICLERGHVLTGTIFRSTAFCPDYIIDTDSTTVLVRPDCNSSWTVCTRCEKVIGFNGTETRKTIWKIKPKKQN